ncbi:DUF3078 domain-containing protein [Flavobacterium sp.]|uniref:DUF3078 domain-containing protein n=1 Tax=Flavobacterium sp. TaxID=239 RepID=UPI0040481969
MKKTYLLGFLLFIVQYNFSQIVRTKLPDTISYWSKSNKVGLDISQITFVNWNAGGNTSISGLAKGNFVREYSKKHLNWKNELIIRYGINKQEGQEVRKTDDQLQINSTFGFKRDTISNLFYSGKLNFNTQFANGYSYPNTENPISKPFAPAYFFLGIGGEYSRKDLNLNVYLSPLTQKTTIVLDRKLSNEGAFGVDPAIIDATTGEVLQNGARSRTEVGILITNQWEKEVFKNINLEHRISLYTDYLNNFGNIDIDWQLQLNMTINEYVRANIGTHIIYDDDIKAKEERDGQQIIVGPKLQLKQLLGVGLVYTF